MRGSGTLFMQTTTQRRSDTRQLSRRSFCASLLSFIYMTLDSRMVGATSPKQRMARLEASMGGLLGVSISSNRRGSLLTYRSDTRFPLCSTSKILIVAAILARVDKGLLDLNQHIKIRHTDLVDYSPETQHAAQKRGMTISEICAAALRVSDNTAANLLIARLGGPTALTSLLRCWGDTQTRVDNTEPAINEVRASEEHDTTTPAAMTALMERFFCTKLLSHNSQALLKNWIIHNKTGDHRLRKGMPTQWQIGDKTGSGPAPRNATNDVAIAWLPRGEILFVAAYLIDSARERRAREACLAAIGQIVATSHANASRAVSL